MNIKTTKRLNNGVEMPYLGLGVYLAEVGDATANAVRWAIADGYVHIDTARVYGNEKSVGEGVRASAVDRDDLFVTTKLWNGDMRSNRQQAAFEDSLRDLGMDYVDLYLIHWPVENYLKSWAVMEEIYDSGKARAIGVSNFQQHHLDKLLDQARIVPVVNQVELHPYFNQRALRDYCAEREIAIEAWSPLGGQGGNVMDDAVIKRIAAAHGKTPAQVIVRWDLQHGIITIPKSVHRDRIKQNSDVFDFQLSDEEMAAIDKLDRNTRVGPDPDNFDF